jgi:outer membrane protein TolC
MSTHFHRLLRRAATAGTLLPALVWAAPLTLDEALDLAVQHSEAARAARTGVSSASQAAHAAGQLPDPVLGVGIDNLPVTGPDRFSTTRDSMTMKRVGISQEWVSSDKRAVRQAAADAMVARETTTSRATEADVRLQTALAYLDAYFTGETLKLATLAESHAREELEAAKGRLASPTGSSQEVLAIAGARGVAEDDSAEVRQVQGIAKVALQRWVGAPVDELAAPKTPSMADEETFVSRHPSVLSAQRDIEVARQEASVAATNRKPNWTWGVAYQQRTGYSDMMSFGVSIPLPVAPEQRQDHETAAKLALVEKAEALLVEATRAATAEYRALSSEAQRLGERVERYRATVIVPAQQRTATAAAAYRSNQGTLVMLFEARHAELEARRKLITLQRDLARTQAQLAFRPLGLGDAR